MSFGLISEAAVFWIRVRHDVQEAIRPPVVRTTCTKHKLAVLTCTLHTTSNFCGFDVSIPGKTNLCCQMLPC